MCVKNLKGAIYTKHGSRVSQLNGARTDNMKKKTITREQWKELCKKYDFWCDYDGISDATYQQAETFIKASAHSDHLFYPMGEFHEC